MAVLTAPEAPLGAERLVDEQQAELPQKDDLCGPFWGLVALRTAGVRAAPSGVALDQEEVAVAAGSLLSPPPRGRSLPPGERGRTDYRVALPVDPVRAGTSAAGLARAIAELARGRLRIVPISGNWHTQALRALLTALSRAAPVAVIANLDTGRLWPARGWSEQHARYLATGEDAGVGSDWSVGHFVALSGLTAGHHGLLVTVADTYRSRGDGGLHRQPAERVAGALRRTGEPGGLLVVVRPPDAEHVRHLSATAGLQVRLWENGSGASSEL